MLCCASSPHACAATLSSGSSRPFRRSVTAQGCEPRSSRRLGVIGKHVQLAQFGSREGYLDKHDSMREFVQPRPNHLLVKSDQCSRPPGESES